jgi:cyclohexyl-isocyanide hydratase
VFDVHLVAADLAPVVGDTGLTIQPTTTLERCPSQVDVVFVPGGMGTAGVLGDADILDFLRDRASRARYVT